MATANLPTVAELSKHCEKFQAMIAQCATAPLPPAVEKKLSPLPSADADDAASASLYSDADTRIFIRCRPVLKHETDAAPIVRREPGHKSCILLAPKLTVSRQMAIDPTLFDVDCTFGHEDSNENVYNTACRELIGIALNGGSATILSYGQTGSGKTFTTVGIMHAMTGDLFNNIGAKTIEVSFIEMSSNGTIDLLAKQPIKITEDVDGSVQLLGASQFKIESKAQFLDLAGKAAAARATKATLRNDASSRSHMAARFFIRSPDAPWAQPGLLTLVDLAGSESTADATTHDKERINETKFINSSLMTLKECVRGRGMAATSPKHVHIPFRQSPLALLCKDSFELTVKRPTKTCLIACVSPIVEDARHTLNSIRYAALVYVSPKTTTIVERSAKDPMGWDRETALRFIQDASRGRLKTPEAILPEGDGRALVQLPEPEFVRRCELCGLGSKEAAQLYSRVWKAVVDSRTANRKCAANVVAEKRKQMVAQKDKENQLSAAMERMNNGF